MTIPDYDEGQFPHPKEREMTIRDKLAAVRCEAAP